MALGVGVALIAFGLFVGPRASLESVLPRIVAWASTRLARDVEIDAAWLRFSLVPELELDHVRIGGTDNLDLVRVGTLHVVFSLTAALRGKLEIEEVTADDVRVVLVRRKDGTASWDRPGAHPPAESPRDESSVAIEAIELRALVAEYRDERNEREFTLSLDSLEGAVTPSGPLELAGTGSTAGTLFAVELRTGSVRDLLNGGTWPIALRVRGANTELLARTQLDAPPPRDPVAGAPSRRLLGGLDLLAEGENLAALEAWLGARLPDVGPYRIRISSSPLGKPRIDSDVDVQLGATRIGGTVRLSTGPSGARAEARLRTPLLALDDLGSPRDAEPGSPSAFDADRLLATKHWSAGVHLDVDDLRWREERLGSASLSLEIDDATLAVERARVETRDGHIEAKGTLAASPHGLRATAEIRTHHVDYGPTLRALGGGPRMSGVAALDVKLEADAPTLANLLGNARGYVDLAIFPHDVDAGALDLWTANLLFEVLPLVDPTDDSKLLCAVGLFDVRGGVMQERALVLDTSQMTVYGDATIDLERGWMKGKFEPKPKRPEWFAVSPRVRVRGPFSNLRVRVKPRKMGAAIARSAISPLLVPLERLLRQPAAPGPAACLAAVDAIDR